jgi:hypothetical protein
MPSPDINDVFSRFPGPVTLQPPPQRVLRMLLGSLVFFAVGVWLIHAEAVPREDRWLLWFFTGLFAVGAVAFAIMLLLRSTPTLLLDGDGFEIGSLFRIRTSRIRWADTSVFEVSLGKMIMFDDTRSARSTVGKAVKGFAGRSGGLPATITAFSAPDLAALLNRWRARALGSGSVR